MCDAAVDVLPKNEGRRLKSERGKLFRKLTFLSHSSHRHCSIHMSITLMGMYVNGAICFESHPLEIDAISLKMKCNK